MRVKSMYQTYVLTFQHCRRRLMVCDRRQSRWTASVWTLLKSINARFFILSCPLRSDVIECYRRFSTVFECVRMHQREHCMNLRLLTVGMLAYTIYSKTISYQIAIICAVSYYIRRFPHGCIMPSLTDNVFAMSYFTSR